VTEQRRDSTPLFLLTDNGHPWQFASMNTERKRVQLYERIVALREIRTAATTLIETFNAQKHHLTADEQIEYSSSFTCDQAQMDQAIEDDEIALDTL